MTEWHEIAAAVVLVFALMGTACLLVSGGEDDG